MHCQANEIYHEKYTKNSLRAHCHSSVLKHVPHFPIHHFVGSRFEYSRDISDRT